MPKLTPSARLDSILEGVAKLRKIADLDPERLDSGGELAQIDHDIWEIVSDIEDDTPEGMYGGGTPQG